MNAAAQNGANELDPRPHAWSRFRATLGGSDSELRKLGIKKSRASNLPVWLLVGLLAAAAAILIASAVRHVLSGDIAIGGAGAVITVAGLLVAVLQWRAGLAEKALDALYVRIALANKMRLKASDAADSNDEAVIAKNQPDDYRFFVFTEIDSLEYAVVRYRFGLGMTDLIVRRAVAHFTRRCKDPTFLATAQACSSEGAYLPETQELVATILGNLAPPHESRERPLAETAAG